MIDTTGMSTGSVLKIAGDYVRGKKIENVVLATTRGDTALLAGECFGPEVNVVAVTHSTGFREDNEQELKEEIRRRIESTGIKVLTSAMPFHSWNDHYRKDSGMIMPSTIIADTLRLFGQGTKVCVEIAMMAGDAGLIPHGVPVLTIAGTGRGADTILLIKACNARRFFSMRVMDVIAKPGEW